MFGTAINNRLEDRILLKYDGIVLGGSRFDSNLEKKYKDSLNEFIKNYGVEGMGNALHVGSDGYLGLRYGITKRDGKIVFEPFEETPTTSFMDMINLRKNGPNVMDTAVCPSIGTTLVMLLNLSKGGEPLGTYMVLTTRQKPEGLWVAGVSGYVNCNDFTSLDENGCLKADGITDATMKKEGHEEALFVRSDGKWVHTHFEGERTSGVKVFGKEYDYSDGMIEVKKAALPWWIPCSNIELDGSEMSAFLDPYHNNGQIVACGMASIDLDDSSNNGLSLSFCHSESRPVVTEIDGEKKTLIVEEFKKDSPILLMKLNSETLTPENDFYNLICGNLVPAESPKSMSELFALVRQKVGCLNNSEFAVATAESISAESFFARFSAI